MSAVTLSPHDVATLLLGLDLVEGYAAGEIEQGPAGAQRREGRRDAADA